MDTKVIYPAGCGGSSRLREWKDEVLKLADEKNLPIAAICEYIGKEASDDPGFLRKLPRKRETYIGIGMALGLSVDDVNRWLRVYCRSRQLYIKDILSDMVWIYLIRRSQTGSQDRNYFSMYDECMDAVRRTYPQIQSYTQSEYVPTADLLEDMHYITEDEDQRELRYFVERNIRAFASAYTRPRAMLRDHVNLIVEGSNAGRKTGRKTTLNSLRGYLDDSMINYICGGEGKLRNVPRTRRIHISMCLAVGMTADSIDRYLELMGYAPFGTDDPVEAETKKLTEKWDIEHPLQRRYKKGDLAEVKHIRQAAGEMLALRQDIRDAFLKDNQGEQFPYYCI